MNLFKELKRRNVFRVGIAYTVATWLLIQVTDIIFPRIGLPDSAVTLVIALLVIGFIPALILAWAFEMTPEGIKREKDIDREKSITPATGRKLDRAIIGILTIALAYFVFDKFNTQGPAPQTVETTTLEASSSAEPTEQKATTVQSVAVLPFTAMSSGEDDGYFADGLTEEILNSLARLPELLVTARTSSFHFKDKNMPVPEIAAALGVENVVEGSVRRSGERVRITAQLIRAEDGFHLWSNTYDRTLEDVFAVQEDIADNIAATLDVVLSEEKRQRMHSSGIKDVEAFIAYQKGMEAFARAHSTSNPVDVLAEANRWFDQALAIAPNISNALYLRTDLYGHIIYDHGGNRRPASEAALKSAQVEIQTSLARAMQTADSDTQRAIIDTERTMLSDNWTGIATKLDASFKPGDCTPANWMVDVAVPFGWAEQLEEHARGLLLCDPLSMVPAFELPLWEIAIGNPQAGVEAADHSLQTRGFSPWVDDSRFLAVLATGDYHDDPDMTDDNPEGSMYPFPRKILLYAMNNDLATAQQVLDEWLTSDKVDDLSLLRIHAAMGNREAANEVASRMDARFGGAFMLAEAVGVCMCGAPFDLDVTPNYKKRIGEAGFNWPPLMPINYPAKDW